jgi:hypothetical protein
VKNRTTSLSVIKTKSKQGFKTATQYLQYITMEVKERSDFLLPEVKTKACHQTFWGYEERQILGCEVVLSTSIFAGNFTIVLDCGHGPTNLVWYF